MREFGSIVAFDLAGGAAAVQPFADALEFFAITPSVGSVESLMLPPQLLRGRGLSKEQQAISGVGEGTIRLSIGIEDADDLIADLDAARSARRRPPDGRAGQPARGTISSLSLPGNVAVQFSPVFRNKDTAYFPPSSGRKVWRKMPLTPSGAVSTTSRMISPASFR